MLSKCVRISVTLGSVCLMAAALPQSNQDLREQVREAERAFAQTMADRDHEAFKTFLSEEVITFGEDGAIRGIEAVADAWSESFDGPQAPFSWDPEIVEVLDSGDLAHSSGPVRDREGNVTGTFNSIWRREPDGSWKVIFDKGCSCRES
jgi:ketosteroid isomerase-like protein